MNHSKPSVALKTKSGHAAHIPVLPVLSGMKDAQGQTLRLDVPQEVLRKLRAMRHDA